MENQFSELYQNFCPPEFRQLPLKSQIDALSSEQYNVRSQLRRVNDWILMLENSLKVAQESMSKLEQENSNLYDCLKEAKQLLKQQGDSSQ